MSVPESLSITTQLPNEIWTTILNFAFDPKYFCSSRKAIINVLSEVSHDFHRLTKIISISSQETEQPPIDFDWTDDISSYCCVNDYGSLLEHALMRGTRPTRQSSIKAARFGSLDCLKILKEHGRHKNFTFSNDVLNQAALSGHIDVFKYLMSLGMTPSMESFIYAVQSGNVDLFKFLQVECPETDFTKYKRLPQHATISGNLEMVKLVEQYLPLEPSHMYGSAYKGSIEILQYCLDKGFTLTEHERIGIEAARKKQWKYLKFALDHGAPMSAKMMAALAKNNAFEIMRELRSKGCPWDSIAMKRAAKKGHFEALKFLTDNGCPFNEPDHDEDPESGSFWEASEVTVIAASKNHIDCLKYLIEIGAPTPDDIIDQCIRPWTNAAVIKYLRERGCSWSETTPVVAVSFFNIAVLKFLHENNCPWDEQTIITAGQERSVNCLKYALDNGCPWSATTMDAVAKFGRLEELKICHEKGVPWTNQTCSLLIQHKTIDELKYAHENGAPWSDETITSALSNDIYSSCFDSFKYAIDHGCPWDPQSTLEITQLYDCHEEIAQWILENFDVTTKTQRNQPGYDSD